MRKVIILTILFVLSVTNAKAFFEIYTNVNIVVYIKTVSGAGDGTFNIKLTDTTPYSNVFGQYATTTVNSQGILVTNSQILNFDIRQDIIPGWEIVDMQCSGGVGNTYTRTFNNTIRVTAIPFNDFTCVVTNKKLNANTPILIIPGVLGSELENTNEKFWINLKMVNPFGNDSFLDGLAFNSDLTSTDETIKSKDIIRKENLSVANFNYSKALIDDFISEGYKEGEDLFTFPYDWRFGVSNHNVNLLKDKIDNILSTNNSQKVNVIAHSTGGLLAKKYINDNINHKVSKLVMVGVPNIGSPKAIKVLLEGDNFGIPGLSDNRMKVISQNMPVVYDLAPSKEYFNTNGSFVKVIEQKFLAKDNVRDLNFDEVQSYLINDHSLNDLAYTNAQNLHTTQFDSFDMRTAGVDVYNIVGCKSGTIGQIVEKRSKDFWGNPIVKFEPPVEVAGDQTVPFESANSILADDDKTFYMTKASHGTMLSANGSRQQIVNLIAGSKLFVDNNIITKQQLNADPKKCEIKGKTIKIMSPVDIEILDNQNRRLGIFTDGSVQNDIPGADINIFDDHKFVFLPYDNIDEYTINLKGTGNGVFTLGIQDVEGNMKGDSQLFTNIPVTTNTQGSLDLETGTILSLDNDGDGSVDILLKPNSVVSGPANEDLLGPITEVKLQGTQGDEGFFRGEVGVKLEGHDVVVEGRESETSALLKTYYSVDGKPFQTYSSSTPIWIEHEGQHTVTYYSIDRAGNSESQQIKNFVIDRTPPEAKIVFNTEKLDLDFEGSDNVSAPNKVKIRQEENSVVLTDQAGNTTELVFKEKSRKKQMKAELVAIKYNKREASLVKNSFSYSWIVKPTKELIVLVQDVRAKKDFKIDATYERGKTYFFGRDKTGKIEKVVPQLVLLNVLTSKGELAWTY